MGDLCALGEGTGSGELGSVQMLYAATHGIRHVFMEKQKQILQYC